MIRTILPPPLHFLFPYPLFLLIPLPISLPYLIFLLNSTNSKVFQSIPEYCYWLYSKALLQSNLEKLFAGAGAMLTLSILSKYDDSLSLREDAELMTFKRSPDVSDIRLCIAFNLSCYVMLCYVTLCYVISCYVILCYVMCYVTLCYVMFCHVMLCYVLFMLL